MFLSLAAFVAVWAESFVDQDMLASLKAEYGPGAEKRGQALNNLIEKLRDEDTETQLAVINRFFNQFTYVSDGEMWGEEDYWATPIEFLGRKGGDCEDFVVGKYFALRALGVDDEHLFLTYVKAIKQNIAHMVLAYHSTPGSIPLVLDNYNPTILPASDRADLAPVYSFNAKSLFLSNPSAGLGQALPTDKIKNSKWDAMLSSMKGDGE